MDYKEITQGDCIELAEIYVTAFNAEPWFEKWSEKTARKRLLDVMGNSGFFGLEALKDGKVIAMVMGEEKQYYDGIVFTVSEFCVKNNFRGKGVGKALFKEFEKRLKEKGIRALELCTIPEDAGFYKKLGLVESETVMMGKEL